MTAGHVSRVPFHTCLLVYTHLICLFSAKDTLPWWRQNASITALAGAVSLIGEGNGTPLQYSCLENPMDGGAWWATVHGVSKSRTRLSDFTFTLCFHALEKEVATHSSVLAWRIPGTGEPGGLPSMGSHRVRHDWSDLAAAAVAVSLIGSAWPSQQSSDTVLLFVGVYWFSFLLINFTHHLEVLLSP